MSSRTGDILGDGLIAGVIGYATVAVFFVIVDPLLGRPMFYTAALLGSAIFYGLTDAAELVVEPGPMIAYNGVHLVVFLVIGMIASAAVSIGERAPSYWYVLAIAFFLIVTHLIGVLVWLPEPVRTALPLWMTVTPTLLAAVAMGAYLVARHPRLARGAREF